MINQAFDQTASESISYEIECGLLFVRSAKAYSGEYLRNYFLNRGINIIPHFDWQEDEDGYIAEVGYYSNSRNQPSGTTINPVFA